jgi:hypothetical protein
MRFEAEPGAFPFNLEMADELALQGVKAVTA